MGYRHKSHSHRPSKGRGSYFRKLVEPVDSADIAPSREDELAEIKMLLDGLEAQQLRRLYD